MKSYKRVWMLMLITAVLLAACGGTAPEAMPATEEVMMEKPTEAAMISHDTPMAETMTEEANDGAMLETPDWYGVALTNVRTGENFTINDLKGKVVLVETMAVWCSNCFRQQTHVKALHDILGERDDFVSLGVDIDPNEDASQLQGFVDSNGFHWTYVVAPAEVSRELSTLYGAQFLNPPSTPMLIIDRQGEAHPLPFGIKSADDLLQALQPFLDESM